MCRGKKRKRKARKGTCPDQRSHENTSRRGKGKKGKQGLDQTGKRTHQSSRTGRKVKHNKLSSAKTREKKWGKKNCWGGKTKPGASHRTLSSLIAEAMGNGEKRKENGKHRGDRPGDVEENTFGCVDRAKKKVNSIAGKPKRYA